MLLLAFLLAPLARADFVLEKDKGGVRHYLKIKAAGRKNLFGTAEWVTKQAQGTPLRWQFRTVADEDGSYPDGGMPVKTNRIQVLGRFKKKDLCLWWRGKYDQPFQVKSCSGTYTEEASGIKFGCKNLFFGRQKHAVSVEDETSKMDNTITANDGNIVCDDESGGDDVPVDLNTSTYDGTAATSKCAGCFVLKETEGKYISVRQVRKNEHKKTKRGAGVWGWEKSMTSDITKAAAFKWGKRGVIYVHAPTDAQIDNKSICLKFNNGKVGEKGHELQIQKCDNTIDNGRFGCTTIRADIDGHYLGAPWVTKKFDTIAASWDCNQYPDGEDHDACDTSRDAALSKYIGRLTNNYSAMENNVPNIEASAALDINWYPACNFA